MKFVDAIVKVFTDPDQASAAVLISVAAALVGVYFTSSVNRRQARKQHTITVLLDASMDDALKTAIRTIEPCLITKTCPAPTKRNMKKRRAFGLLLNHYEFIAAGLRNGDFDEMLVYDSEHHNILEVYNTYLPNILLRQKERKLGTLYEHLAWLDRRWSQYRPFTWRRAWQTWWSA